MILVDTSVWVDHLSLPSVELADLLLQDIVPGQLVVNELAVGSLPSRLNWLRDLGRLPSALVARHHEVLTLIEGTRLFGRGIGYNDVHLLASARLSRSRLWTRDRRLAAIAEELDVGYG